MWYRDAHKAWAGVLGVFLWIGCESASAAVLDVCATCVPYTTLDSAFAAAGTDDTIILDGPDLVTDPDAVYTLTTDLVIDALKNGIEIRGKSGTRPDKIIVVGTGAGPVVTVEQGFKFVASGFTISGGTTGILAMQTSDVDIRRCLIEGVSGVGVDCINPATVYLAATVITGCTDAVKIDLGGELNITQCTFLNNSNLGVNVVAGATNVTATLIYDSGVGMADATGTSLGVAGNWVTDAGGVPIPSPGGAVDAYEFTDVLDPLVVFDTTDNFPGEIDDLYTPFPRTGESAATLNAAAPVVFFARDFGNLARSSADMAIGADERVISAVIAAWTECYIVQNGQVRNWITEGPLSIEVVTPNINLGDDAVIWIGHPPGAPITDPANRIGPLTIDTPSTIDDTFGFVNYTVVRDDFVAAFPILGGAVDVDGYEIYIHTNNDTPESGTPEFLDGTATVGTQAEEGRIFGFDTIPPQILNAAGLADRYLSPPSDTYANFTPGPDGWGGTLAPNVLVGDLGANFGRLDANAGDPQVFFNGPSTALLDFTIEVVFADPGGSGFAPAGATITESADTSADKRTQLYRKYEDEPGMAWWSESSESEELTGLDNAPRLDITYDGTTPDELTVRWAFEDAVYGTSQWHAIANIRVTDMAGNEATLDRLSERYIPLRPLHLWWFASVIGEFRSGPAGATTENPVMTWGLNRFGGEDPKDPEPVFPSVQFYLWRADSAGVPNTDWTDISGGWSDWLKPANRTITLDTYFNDTMQLRDIITSTGGADGDEYLIAVRGYDEAGNIQVDGAGANFPPVLGPVIGGVPPLSYHRWTDPGPSAASALDTKVQPVFWHNSNADRVLDGGERSFGAATRIPLPGADVVCTTRVEAGFAITMEIADPRPTNRAAAYYELLEDGLLVARGYVRGGAGNSTVRLVIPEDLLNPLAGHVQDLTVPLAFLNYAPLACGNLQDRLGDDGEVDVESINRKHDVKYQLSTATMLLDSSGTPEVDSFGEFILDTTPATVEFTVTVDRGLKDDQPIKSFSKE